MSDDSAIEEIARAICKANGRDPDAPRWIEYPGGRTSGICWHGNIDAAKAALRVLAAKDAPDADPQRETCSECQGSGYGGHPDSGALCVKCNGTGEVAALKDEPQ
jgi:hypothetical protein